MLGRRSKEKVHSKAVDRAVRRVPPVRAAARAPCRNVPTGTEMLHLYRLLGDGCVAGT